MPLLEVENVHTYYGQIHALKGVSLTVDKGEIVTLIGANGPARAPCSRPQRFVAATAGFYPSRWGGPLSLSSARNRGKGLVQVPEGRRVFGRLTVTENLEWAPSLFLTKSLSKKIWNGSSTFFPD